MIKRVFPQAERALWSVAYSGRYWSSVPSMVQLRGVASSSTEVFTRLSDENDPKRDAFFKYSWGTWLVNDKLEKEKRTTRFSIEGLHKILSDLYNQSTALSKTVEKGSIPPPSYNSNLTVSLPHNIRVPNIGTLNPNEKVQITKMSSIHEGKHHRIYKIDTNLGKAFVLRIPYALDNETAISHRLKSEVATMDFVDLKLGIKTPKVYCFGYNGLNPLRQPFILQEYIDGKLLMRDWNPLVDDKGSDGKPDDSLTTVIDKVSDLQAKLLSITFNKFGSLYFSKDYNDASARPIYEGETNKDLQDRWTIGPSTERSLWRRKKLLSFEAMEKYLGPWAPKEPMQIVKDTSLLELENVKMRLAAKESATSAEAASVAVLQEQMRTFENLSQIANQLFNPGTKSVTAMPELLKPRLYQPDLDPMNVIVPAKGDEPYLLDFEGSSIKPLVLHSSPQFVAYDGPKIYNIAKDVPDFDKLSEQEKAQCQFMYKRTRNQFLWESAFNQRTPKLISVVSPSMKLLRSPYIAMIEEKTDMEYLLIDEALIQLREVWDIFANDKLVGTKTFPIDITDNQVEKHQRDLQSFHQNLLSSPFAATRGWIPQDMFDNLVQAGVLVQDGDGNYTMNTQSLAKEVSTSR